MENSTTPLDPRIQGLLQSLRSRIRIYVWLEGFSLAIIWITSMFWVGLAMDYLPILLGANELSPLARGILLGVVAVALGYILYHWVFRRAFVKFSDRSMAILLERQFAGFNDSLVTSVTLKNQASSDTDSTDETYSIQMLSETIETALLSVDSVNVNQVFNKPLLLKRALLACLLLASVGAFSITNSSMANLAMRRLYLLDSEKWERAAHIQLVGISVVRDDFTSYDFQSPDRQAFVDGRVKVARGATLRLLINADGQKRIPDRCIFHYETGDGVSGRRRLLKEGGATGKDQYFVLADNPLDAIADSMEFEIVGHDHRIGPFYIDVVDSPEISQVTLDNQYPAYTEKLDDQQDWIPGRTSLPLGTNLKLNLRTNKPLQQLHMTDPASAQYLATFTTVPDARTQKPIAVTILLQSPTPDDAPELWNPSMLRGLENPEGVPVQFTLEQNELQLCDQSKNIIPGKGILYCLSTEQIPIIVQLNTVNSEFVFPVQDLQRDLLIDVSLFDRDGIISTKPFTVAISALADQPPNVEISLDGIGTAITPDAIIPVTGSVSDDYGVYSSWFDIQLDEGDPLKFPIELAEGNIVQTPLDFRLERASDQRAELTPGEKVNLSVRANDKYDLHGDPNTGSSSQFTLDVVTPEELLAGLERRELALRQRFELILAEVQGMRDSLQLVLESTSLAAEVNNSDEPEDNADEELSPAEKKLREESLRLLRTQRAVVQSQKSNQESLGIANSFDDIRLQLINNRVDTEDHKNRLLEKISDPLRHICEVDFPSLDLSLSQLESNIGSETLENESAAKSLQQADIVLLQLTDVLDNMLELETYNELIDLIRNLINDQEQIGEKTKQERKKQVLDLLK